MNNNRLHVGSEEKLLKINNKIFIPVVVAAMVVGVTGLLYLDAVNDDTASTTQKEIEPKSYRVGLLPPPESIFNTIEGISGIDEAADDHQGIFSHLLNIFDGYDEMMIFVYDSDISPPDMGITVLLSMNPVTDDTSFQGFIYYEEGIRIDIGPKGDYTQDDLLSNQNFDEIHFNVTHEVIGQYTPMGVQEMGDETYDTPAQLAFVDNEHYVLIRGFLTDDRMLTLATALVQ